MASQESSETELIKSNVIALSAFGFFFLTKLLYWFPKDISQGINLWAYTDWLIDYSSGFVRRGLSGELVDILNKYAHPKLITGVLAWVILDIVVLGYMRLLARSIKELPLLLFIALLFLPNLLPFYLYDHGAFGRKEIIGYLFLLYNLYSLETNKTTNELTGLNSYIKKLLPITFAFLPMHVLIHEASFLLFVPTHIIITYSVMKLRSSFSLGRRIFYTILIYLPVFLAFFAVFVFGRPNFEVALEICKKWEYVNALEAGSCSFLGDDTMMVLPGAITSLPWSFSQATSLSLSLSRKIVLAWVINFTVLSFSTIYVSRMTVHKLIKKYLPSDSGIEFKQKHARGISYKYFLLPLLISAPLYLLGWDMGRWFAVTCINYIIISLSRELNYVEGKLDNKTELITKLLRVLIILVGLTMIIVGLSSHWMNLRKGGFGQAQAITVSFGIGILGLAFMFALRQWPKKHANPIPNFGAKTELIFKLLRIFILLVGAIMILIGLLADWIGLGGSGFGQTQALAILFGIGLIGLSFIFLPEQEHKKYYERISNLQKSNFRYYVNWLFFLIIIFSIRLPHFYEHDAYKMLAEPFKSLVQNIFGTP